MNSREIYTEYHESEMDLRFDDTDLAYDKCDGCEEHFSNEDLIIFEDDYICADCAKALGIRRCGFCGSGAEEGKPCEECGADD